MKKLSSLVLLSFLAFGCASGNGRKVTNEEIKNMGLWEHTNSIVCDGPAEQKNRTCHRYECHKSTNADLECYENSVDAKDIRQKVDIGAENLMKDAESLDQNPCVYVQKYVSDNACTSSKKEEGKIIMIGCVGDSYSKAPMNLRGLCGEKTCRGKNLSCTIKGSEAVISWLAGNQK